MRIDFGTKRHEHKEPVSFKIPSWILKVGAGVIGILILVLFISTLLSQAAASHPYAVFIFAKPEKEKPQASVQFLWIDEQKKQVTLISVPDDLEYTSTILGTYPVSSIYAARTLSSMSDTDFIRDLSFFFRMPVSGYVQSTGPVNGKLGLLRGLSTFCLNPAQRSLSFSTCIHFVLYGWHPSTTLTIADLSENVFSPVNSSSMRPVDRTAYTQWRKRNLSYELSGASKISIAVINVSGKTGAAGRVSSLFDDFGLYTLLVTDSANKQDSGIIFVHTGQKDAEVVRFIADLLHLSVEENDEKTDEYRSDIVVFIGEKEAKAFTP